MTHQEFKTIYDQYVVAIRNMMYYRTGDADIADDITQDAFITLWEKQLQIKNNEVKPLLYKIANDRFIDLVRKKKLETDYSSELRFHLKQQIDQSEEHEKIKHKCEQALQVLTEKERTVFLMNKKDGIPYADIAENLDISVKAVEKRMKQALTKLKNEQTKSKINLSMYCMLY